MDDAAAVTEAPHFADQCDDRPFANEAVVLSKLEYIELKAQCNDYKALFEQAQVREADLNRELERERAKVRDLNQRLYGRQSEQRKHRESLPKLPVTGPARSRGATTRIARARAYTAPALTGHGGNPGSVRA